MHLLYDNPNIHKKKIIVKIKLNHCDWFYFQQSYSSTYSRRHMHVEGLSAAQIVVTWNPLRASMTEENLRLICKSQFFSFFALYDQLWERLKVLGWHTYNIDYILGQLPNFLFFKNWVKSVLIKGRNIKPTICYFVKSLKRYLFWIA